MITSLIETISHLALDFISSTGYLGLFLLSAVESMAIPIPSEVVVPFSGFLAATGRFSLVLVILIATLANVVGSALLYIIGKSGGRWVLEKYGKYVLIRKEELERGDRWFARYGGKAAFWSRMLPIVRTFSSLPAGMARMPFGTFIIYTSLGSLPWNALLAYIGYKAGENWDVLHPYFQKGNYVILALIVAAVLFWALKRRKKS